MMPVGLKKCDCKVSKKNHIKLYKLIGENKCHLFPSLYKGEHGDAGERGPRGQQGPRGQPVSLVSLF